jgi:hypothetical protein
MDAPIFLVGARRSGTTLLRLMLDGHPEIAWPTEFDYAIDWREEEGGWPRLEPYHEHLALSRLARDAGASVDASLSPPDLVRSLLDQLRARSSKPRFGVTVHQHYERLLRLWPGARFIYLLRDGRDVARSHVEMGWNGNVWAGAQAWSEAERSWRELAAQLTPDRRLEVRFEALVAEPRRELQRICDFVGVDWHTGMLRYPEYTTYGPVDPGMAGRWRGKLSRREQSWLMSEIGESLQARGYPAGDVPPAWIPAPRRLALQIADRMGVIRFRIRRYGLRLWARHHVAVRLGRSDWRRESLVRMQAVDAQFLK